MQKINELTPNLNFKKDKFFKFKKIENPLQQTKVKFSERSKFTEKELKEFSILFLVMNNLNIFKKNIESFVEADFSSVIMQELKQEIINLLLSKNSVNAEKLKLEDVNSKFKDIFNQINTYAPVKIILKNKNEEEIIMIFNEVIGEIKKIKLRDKIESLEDKVSLNLDEKLYSELLSLRNQLKGG